MRALDYRSYGLLVYFYLLYLSHYLSLSYYHLHIPTSLHTFSHPRGYQGFTGCHRKTLFSKRRPPITQLPTVRNSFFKAALQLAEQRFHNRKPFGIFSRLLPGFWIGFGVIGRHKLRCSLGLAAFAAHDRVQPRM